MNIQSILRTLRLIAFTTAVVFTAGQSPQAEAAAAGTVDLGLTPPDLTSSVDPNVLVTFDDSGSMASDFMGDKRPFNSSGWSGKPYCAGVIGGDSVWAATGMNGVYYNPNVLYLPPVNADGSSFGNADATLTAVQKDGITARRPLSPSGTTTTQNFLGINTRVCGRSCTGTDNRWKCPGDSTSPLTGGGPYYYRLKNGAALGSGTTPDTSVLYDDTQWEAVAVTNASLTIDGVTTTGYQNWANWYAYYRTRNMMTRTALSRVFGNLGSNIRGAFQNINDGRFLLPGTSIITNLFDTGAFATCKTTDPTTDFSGAATTQPACYRSAFFNWIFQTPAAGSTPDRRATIRAGEFFKRGNGNTAATGNLKDPYWQLPDATIGAPARELSCRQNFHMLVTDGYWNEDNTGYTETSTNPDVVFPAISTMLPSNFTDVQTPPATLPDGKSFSRSDGVSRVFWDVPASTTGGCGSDGSTNCYPSLADIGFSYWARDLRSDLTNNVAPYMPDKTTGITGTTAYDPNAAPPANDPRNNPEIYYNPANDPASWQHVVQFMVTLGIAGRLTYSDDVDCVDANNDLCKLRKAQVNSTGATGWPQPARNEARAIDDTWHAAINSRGSYFSASDPGALVRYLTAILASVLSRSTSSTQPTLSLPFAFSGAAAFSAGYDSSDWSGKLTRVVPFDAAGRPLNPPTLKWDASCTLTGGTCPDGTKVARDPATRVILSSDGGAGRNHGIAFKWASMSTTQQARLNANPVKIAASPNNTTWTSDTFGDKRVGYLRGERTYEVGGTPQFRRRGSVFGAVVNAQPLYNASPDSGWFDSWPTGSPEAAVVDTNADYSHFVNDNKNRPATVYAASDDGMLHAINAVDGTERWAYVPNTLIENGNLTRMTDKSRGLTPGVDNKPTIQDVFIDGAWHTVLVGALRLGGRGIYALDVTNPAGVLESNPSGTVLWEYSNKSTGGANLGYTYGSPHIARLQNGKWAVMVPSGYYPKGPTTDAYDDPASTEAAASKTSLLIIDLQTGALITELKTSTAPQASGVTTYGLSTPDFYDLGGDQVDDIGVAGDLAGNVWRFDLTSANPASWAVDLLFKTYPSAATNGATGTCTAVGQCPVSVMPVGMRNPAARGIVWIFGTGKFLGKDDRNNAIPTQSFYGIYDYGLHSSNYPILPSKLNVQGVKEDTAVPPNRFVSKAPVTTVANAQGWTLPLNIAAEQGERNVVAPYPLDSNNTVILPTLIPTSDDPCTPGRRGALMVLDAASGNGIAIGPSAGSPPGGYVTAGKVDTSGAIPVSGELSPWQAVGGGTIGIAGIPGLTISDNYWYRTAWRELLDVL